MKTRTTLMAVAILLCGFAVPLAAVEKTGTKPVAAKEVQEPRKQIAELKTKVGELESRLETFESATRPHAPCILPKLRQLGIVTNLPPLHIPFLSLPCDRSARQKIWGGGEING